MTSHDEVHAARAAGLLFAWVPIILVGPALVFAAPHVLPRLLENWVFFLPQVAFPYTTFRGAPPTVGPRLWPGLWVIYWALIAGAFIWSSRRSPPARTFFVAGLVITVATIVLQIGIAAAGLYFELDGP